MLYDRISPALSLSNLIDCYWVVENDEIEIVQQKIIPDGFPEIIFHYGSSYRINISGTWEIQSKMLLAGQIRNHFLLENTGVSGMIGIKFKPAGITRLFDLSMNELNDKVVDLESILSGNFEAISEAMLSELPYKTKAELLDTFFEAKISEESAQDQIVNRAVNIIFDTKGLISVSDLTNRLGVNERKLERLFKRYVGLDVYKRQPKGRRNRYKFFRKRAKLGSLLRVT